MGIAQLDAALLRADCRYDPETGEWTRVKTGEPIGAIDVSGYCYFYVRGIRVWAHRAAWLYVTGVWPSDEIDHRDRDRSNNRWDNLREATRQQNSANFPVMANNKIGLKGVSLCKATGRYRADITVSQKKFNLGRYDTPEAAHEAYRQAASNAFGEFARAS